MTSPACRNCFSFAQPSLSGLLLLEKRASQAVPSHLVHGRSLTFIGVQPQQIGVASKRSPSSVQALLPFSRNNTAKVVLVFRMVCCLHTTWFAEGRGPWSAQTCRIAKAPKRRLHDLRGTSCSEVNSTPRRTSRANQAVRAWTGTFLRVQLAANLPPQQGASSHTRVADTFRRAAPNSVLHPQRKLRVAQVVRGTTVSRACG